MATANNSLNWNLIETAPKDGTHILLWDGAKRVLAFWGEYENGWMVPWEDDNLLSSAHNNEGEYAQVRNPSHWIPLPEAPVKK